MRIVITGSSGFIGSYLVRNLSKKDIYELRLIDISEGIDICKWDQVKDFADFDVIIHLANKSYVPDSYENPQLFYHTNVISTLNALELCRLRKARFIYLSSYVYGHPDYQPVDEKHQVRPFNPYAQSKLICEKLCEGYSRDFNVPVIILRPFNIYGSGQNGSFLIPSIIKQAKAGSILVKDERPKRDYLHVEDLVRAIELSIEYNDFKGTEIFNIGSGKSFSVRHIVDIVMNICGSDISYNCTNEYRPSEVLDTIADITKIQKTLEWDPQIQIEEGLQLMFNESV
jgi:nucleoside-diphosphate-sugar epimerase